jgi:hypothetical protein
LISPVLSSNDSPEGERLTTCKTTPERSASPRREVYAKEGISVPTVKLRIIAQPAEPDEFGQQVDLIRSSGARFDGSSKTWWLILAPETTSPDVLNPLFQAAMEYHTLVEATQGDE